MHLDKVVEGNVFLRNDVIKCCIGISDGKIVALKKILKGEKHYDFGDKLILPACIDTHVHFRQPGYEKKEIFYTGSLAAAYGGIGCILEMPNTQPFVSSKTTFMDKIIKVRRDANVDFSMYCGVTPEMNITDTNQVAKYYKIYFSKSTSARICTLTDCKNLFAHMDKNKIVAAHCELDDKFLKIRYSDLKSYLKARPNVAEAICIDQFVNLQSSANHIGFHICHVSTKESVEILRAKKSAGFKVTAEVAPHHLFLNVDSNLKKGFGKVNPPLRTIDDQNALLAALNNGTIDMIASDHAPHLVSEKNLPFEEAESGLPGVETMVPLLLKTVKDGKIPLYRFVALTSTQPAEIFGLNGKGRIETKFDADLIVVNIRDVRKICAEHLHSLCNWTPYENFEAIFPSHLMIRGEWIVENFEFTLERYGRFLKL